MQTDMKKDYRRPEITALSSSNTQGQTIVDMGMTINKMGDTMEDGMSGMGIS